MTVFRFLVDDLLELVSEFGTQENEDGDEIVRFVDDGDAIKCGGCNWTTSSLYVLAVSREEASSLIMSGDAGMCGECFAEYLVGRTYTYV